MRVASVVGARPQFIKLAPVARAMAAAGIDHVIIHTGQHYDEAMSKVFFADLAIPAPDVDLAVGSGSHGQQTGAMLAGLEQQFDHLKPNWVLVYGDTNSTLAGALAAAKSHWPVAHLEAGLRSFNRLMPEEHNRVLTDHAADLLLAPTQVAMDHLANEGLLGKARLVGDVMTDVCFAVRDALIDQGLPQGGDYLVCTVHRAENTDDPERLDQIVSQLAALPLEVRLLVHPRLRDRAKSYGLDLATGSLRPSGPLPYPEMVRAVLGSCGVVTDSGGLQKEAYLLGRVCTTLRTETEWPETLLDGWNLLAPDLANLADLATRPLPSAERRQPYGDGQAAQAVVAELQSARPHLDQA
ncbi:MAG: UDP-N-acetylglucosamine 2-epimerase (non-hydrolyzing) [Micrococcales bacterium]|nr:UDP-N-acetylglucosamine 2-epimerase (non-hydrolyzing) [Micrococcales bacterium]